MSSRSSRRPGTAKKYEGMRPQLWDSGYKDIDATIDTRELGYMLKQAGVDLAKLPEGNRDKLMGESTGGATIFGVTGGVMEAALRYAYEAVTKKKPESWDFKAVRGLNGLKEATVAVVHGADEKFKERASQDNVQVQAMYKEYLDGHPMSHKAEKLLHTTWQDRSKALEKLKAEGAYPNPRAKEFDKPTYPYE